MHTIVSKSSTVLSKAINCSVQSHQLFCPKSSTVLSKVNNCSVQSHQLFCSKSSTILSKVINCSVQSHQLFCPNPSTVQSKVINCSVHSLTPSSFNICTAIILHIVRRVRDIWVQILPKAPYLAERSPMSYCLEF